MSPDPSPDSPGTASLTLPDDVTSPAAARRFVAELVTDLHRSTAYDVSIAVSELVTNSVRHGRPPITVQVDRAGADVTVSVHDAGRSLPPVRPDAAPSVDPGGRGLLIIAAIGTRWGIDAEPDGTGKTVWVTFSTAGG